MAKLKSVPKETVQAPQEEQKEPQYAIGKKAVDALFANFIELPYKIADPLVKFLQQNLRLIEEPKSNPE